MNTMPLRTKRLFRQARDGLHACEGKGPHLAEWGLPEHGGARADFV